MTFVDWQQLSPEAAAREVRRRAEEHFSAPQRKAAIAALLDEKTLAGAFAAAPPGSPARLDRPTGRD